MEYTAVYRQELVKIKDTLGDTWPEVVRALDEANLLPNQSALYSLSVNFTALDSRAIEVQAAGRVLLRRHGRRFWF
jgi:hypothetical protein